MKTYPNDFKGGRGTNATALYDIGASSNFVSPQKADEIGAHRYKTPNKSSVSVADGRPYEVSEYIICRITKEVCRAGQL